MSACLATMKSWLSSSPCSDTLPANIQVSELYFKAGRKNVPSAQRNCISSNYTHIARDMFDAGANVLVQTGCGARDPDGLSVSLSCNPDTGTELMEMYAGSGKTCISIGQVHLRPAPFMEHDAEIGVDAFDLLVRNSAYDKTLFAVPNTAVPIQDYATACTPARWWLTAVRCRSVSEPRGCGWPIPASCASSTIATTARLSPRSPTSRWRSLPRRAVRPGALCLHGNVCQRHDAPDKQGVVKRKVYDNLALQLGLNSGAIGHEIDERLYHYCRARGLIPARLEQSGLDELKYWEYSMPPRCWRTAPGPRRPVPGQRYGRTALFRRSSAQGRAATAQRPGTARRVFLGPADFYRKLRELDAAGQEQICMTRSDAPTSCC